ncbi:dipeptide ABC transporter ATP-binding protein [Conexibacter arvalis]|uniref:ABC-type glutathione transport system ATPase component n=1 Tax=Conexibacter arvalis TaxID=912552 RepID=A0A840ICP2_9ACTN|nr:ABC transporter ATP-binding protein [Conexibacter arvalis]MBB4662105.1 ABC-type glutathione transport system ATPase component [Conexibacter arvalis]
MNPILSIDGLEVEFPGAAGHRAVRGVSIDVAEGELVGIVGESGSGKSMTLSACLGLVPPPGRVAGGSIRLQGEELVGRSEQELRRIRGSRISMVLQDPMTSLHPSIPVGKQLVNVVRDHAEVDRDAAAARVVEALEMVGVPRAAERLSAYPHQLSGGLRQRVMIAAAIVNRPRVLLADEPTTALDVTVQAQILRLLRELNRDAGITVVLVTHNFGVVAGLCDRTVVMRGGTVLEDGPTERVFRAPEHAYTQALLDAVPRIDVVPERATRPPAPVGEPILEASGLTRSFRSTQLFGARTTVDAMRDVSLDVRRGETLGLVGESGAGKTTLARTLVRLQEPTSGTLLFDGRDVTHASDKALRDFRRRVQMIFQDPYSSLDPRWTVERIVAEPLLFHGLRDRGAAPGRVAELLELVGLSPRLRDRLPRQLSGGERQRVAIARALAVEPDVVVADEPVSALDVSIQAQIVTLFDELQRSLNLTLVLVAHDLGLVRAMCDRVAVMRAGELVELSATEALFAAPAHPYTRTLLDSVPVPDPQLARTVHATPQGSEERA